jgi:exonuclease VII small subunit
MDAKQAEQALAPDPRWERAAHSHWLALMDLAVWADLRLPQLGAVTRLRKRVLELGECLRSVGADRQWIPHPRERMKNALASTLRLRQCLRDLERIVEGLDEGTQSRAFRAQLAELAALAEELAPLERAWAQWLDAQYREDPE